MSAFEKALGFVLPHESEYARNHWGDVDFIVSEDVPGDSGGVTKFGIDQASHPNVDIEHLTLAQATAIYRDEWDSHRLDLLPEKLAILAFDVFVNGGFAIRWLQHAYNLTADHDALLVEDGDMGPATIKALGACPPEQIDAIAKGFIEERNGRFRVLAQSPDRKKFLNGWLQRDADLEKLLLA